MHAVRLDNKLNGSAMQVRVVQGHEPRHFLKIFKGKLITFTGGHASGFKNIQDNNTYDIDGTRLFRVRGTCAEDVRADQMAEVAASLASADVFVLETPDVAYVWRGVGASDFEDEMAASIVGRIAPDATVELVKEGSEPAAFWDAIGGPGDYDRELDPPGAPFLEPRLFHCRILANGKFRVEEVGQFEQTDLDVDDIMVLDGGDELYVWEGQGSTEEEKEKSIEMANVGLRVCSSGRTRLIVLCNFRCTFVRIRLTDQKKLYRLFGCTPVTSPEASNDYSRHGMMICGRSVNRSFVTISLIMLGMNVCSIFY